MLTSEIIILGIAFLVFVFLLWLFNHFHERRWREFMDVQKKDQSISIMGEWLHEMRSSLDRHTEILNSQMQNSSHVIGERLDNATRVIGMINKELGQVQEIARQMRDFQDLLRSPKLRGNIGEVILKELLIQVLPKDSFQLQYRFLDGKVIDAVITTDRGLIPIDSKFPFENFQRAYRSENEQDRRKYLRLFERDIKYHIDGISSKYIQPQEGTVDFAVMYIPSEAIFYELVSRGNDMVQFAQQKRILLVSPNSFYYFLRVILTGMEGRRIEEASRRILAALNTMRQDSQKVTEQLRVVSTHITHAKTAVDRLNGDFLRLSNRLEEMKYLQDNTDEEK